MHWPHTYIHTCTCMLASSLLPQLSRTVIQVSLRPSISRVLLSIPYVLYTVHVQWNPSNPDTIGPEESVLIREVSLFQRWKSTQTWNLGKKKVSCLERCPYFRGVLIERFQCTNNIMPLLVWVGITCVLIASVLHMCL